MRKFIFSLLLFLSLAACSSNFSPTRTTSVRFEVVSSTYLGADMGRIVIFRDNVLKKCMASHLYSGVMSWSTPCDQSDYDRTMMKQMLEISGESLNLSNAGENRD